MGKGENNHRGDGSPVSDGEILSTLRKGSHDVASEDMKEECRT